MRVEQGRGTTVQPRDAWNLLDPVVLRIALEYDDDLSLLDDLIVVRRVLEREMARAAAARLSDDELAALAENLEQMEGSYDDYERFRGYDQGFHAIVMKASGNEVGLTIVRGDPPPRRCHAAARLGCEPRRVEGRRPRIIAGSSRRSRPATASWPASGSPAHIESAWAERKDRATQT